jgi:hypothetical protein
MHKRRLQLAKCRLRIYSGALNESIQFKVQALHALKKMLRPYEMGIRTYSKGSAFIKADTRYFYPATVVSGPGRKNKNKKKSCAKF